MSEPVRGYVPTGHPLFSLIESADVRFGPEPGRVVVDGRWGRVELASAGTPLLTVLHRMTLGPVSLGNVAELQGDYRRWREGRAPIPLWWQTKALLDRLGGYVVPSLGAVDGGVPELSLFALVRDAVFDFPEIPPSTGFAIGDSVRLRSRPGQAVLTGAGRPYAAELGYRALSVASALRDRPRSIEALAAATALPSTLVRDVLAYLLTADLVVAGEP